MQISVNGIKQDVPSEQCLLDLLKHLEISPKQIAVEINLTVINTEAYHVTTLNEGDKIEIISFIGGGAHAG